MLDWDRFLPLARCPKCRAPLSRSAGSLTCERGHEVETTAVGVPLFAPSPRPLAPQEVEQRKRHVEAYAGLNAFGYQVIGSGHAEGLYRTVSDVLLSELTGRRDLTLLDAGCGVGRTVRDLASYLPDAFVVGIDRDEFALDLACAALVGSGPPPALNLRSVGFGDTALPKQTLANIFLAQCLIDRLPLATAEEGGGFAAVASVNLLDRVPNPETALATMASLVQPGGVLLLADPLDWWQADGALWDRYGRSIEGIAGLVRSTGFQIELAMDGLLYREMNDARGSYTDWPVALLLARRPE